MRIDAHSSLTIAFQNTSQFKLQSLDTRTNPFQSVGVSYLSAAQSLFGIRDLTKEQRTQAFAQMSLQAVEMALSPVSGAPVKFALYALAGTGEGKRVVKFVGH